jgi:hypothetical protein
MSEQQGPYSQQQIRNTLVHLLRRDLARNVSDMGFLGYPVATVGTPYVEGKFEIEFKNGQKFVVTVEEQV